MMAGKKLPVTLTGEVAELRRQVARLRVAAASSSGGGFATLDNIGINQTLDHTGATAPTGVDIDSGWSLTDGVGDHGMSVVSGQPQYGPGIYVVQVVLGMAPDPTEFSPEGKVHSVRVSELLVGEMAFAYMGYSDLCLSGTYYWTTDTLTSVGVRYDAGTSNTVIVENAHLYVARVGSV